MRYMFFVIGAALVSVQVFTQDFNSLTFIGWGIVTVASLRIIKKMKGI